jgi:hypothetical protein
MFLHQMLEWIAALKPGFRPLAPNPKRTFWLFSVMSAFGGKADINGRQSNVCF